MLKIKLDKQDLLLVNATHKESSRPWLKNICLKDGELATTDGYILVVREAEVLEGEHEGETLIPCKIFDSIKSIKRNERDKVELEVNEEGLSISFKDKNGEPFEFSPNLSFKSHRPGGSFPYYNALFPENTEKVVVIGLQVSVLKRLLSCLPDNGHLRLGIRDNKDSVEYECTGMDRPIRGLIMPMFLDWESFQWHRNKKKDETDAAEGRTVEAANPVSEV